MSVIVRKTDDTVPPDYIRISEEEALNHQLQLISTWKPSSEMWPFSIGPGCLSIVAAFTGAAITGYMRRKLKLLQYGRVAMLATSISIPGILTPLIMHKTVVEPLVLQNECPICIQVRGAVIQSGLGVAYPTLLSCLSGFYIADRYGTYRLPSMSFKTAPQFITIAQDLLRPMKNKFVAYTIINSLAAMFIADRQSAAFYHMARKIKEQETYED